MSSNIFYETILQKRVLLDANEFNNDINNKLQIILKDKFENKCVKEGFIEDNSINIINRSVPYIYGNQMNGKFAINVQFSVKLCCPVKNNIIKCTIKKINKLGILASVGPLSIIVARQFHKDKDIFKNLKEDMEIEIKVIDKKFKVNDNTISVIAKIYKEDDTDDIIDEDNSDIDNEELSLKNNKNISDNKEYIKNENINDNNLSESDIDESDIDKSDIDESDIDESDTVESNVEESDIDESDINESDIDGSDIDETDIDETDIDENNSSNSDNDDESDNE